ncbi:MAG: hypothetical protein HC937_02930, partial [Aquincola sp.]|nr:hypothetical protein [Aquincola sp.]
MKSPCSFARRHPRQILALLPFFALGLPASTLLAQCGPNSPAFPVPQFRNAVELWPTGFQPVLPGLQLPEIRDSTQYISLTHPNQQAGHELFRGMDIAGNHLFVA